MTTYANPASAKNLRSAPDASDLVHQYFEFDFANTAYRPSTIAANDLLEIAIVPAGHRSVPHLWRIDMIPIDTDGSPTGDYSIGTSGSAAALKASTASETAAYTMTAEDFALSTAEVGSRTADTSIYVKAINASATAPTTGKIKVWAVYRAWDVAIDG